MPRPQFILASASPRRAELLTKAGYEFTVQPADVDESVLPGERPADYVLRVARAKARAVAAATRETGSTVLAADTTVVMGGEILAKPADRGRRGPDAESAVGRGPRRPDRRGASIAGERELTEVVLTRVHFLPLSPEEIAWYVESGEPEGKAGAYAIQERAARFVDWIEGSWSNVVGLPVATVDRMLKKLGA